MLQYLASPVIVQPICPYYSLCGGCSAQEISYPSQLEAKAAWLKDLFSEFVQTDFLPILGSDRDYPTFFRNKIRFSFIEHEGVVWPSRHPKGSSKADIPVEKCYLQSEKSNSIIRWIAQYATLHNWSLYNPEKQQGWLKHILIREGKGTRECMLCLVTDESTIPNQKQFVKEITHALPFLTSLYQTVSWGKSLEKLDDRHLWGSLCIHEDIEDKRYVISPQSFFQTNSEMVGPLYKTIQELAGPGNTLWDLYAGSATIGIFLSNHFKNVVSFEQNPSNCRDAEQNFKLNSVNNVEIIEGSVEASLTSNFLNSHAEPDCIVIDPARAGLSESMRQLIPNLKAQKIIYVSCNPVTALRDIKQLTSRYSGYQLESIKPIDMFPHSWHCEMVAVLKRK